jgi:hypothetical protein
MSRTQLLLGHAGTVFVITALAGVIIRRRWRLWYTFALLLLVVTVHDVLVALWPSHFHRNHVWRAKEITLVLIRLAMVVEFTTRVFRHFPGAMAAARRVVALILGVTFVVAMLVGRDSSHYQGFVGQLMPRLLNGTIWLFTSLAVLILWYRLPVHWFPKAILLSYVPYLLVFTVAMNALGELGWQRAAWVDRGSTIAYIVLVLYWTWLAWRADPVRPVSRQPEDRSPA